jgi:oxygen-independent coproporphyrinogen-3 oxidase
LVSKNLAGIYLHIPFCKQACSYCDFHFSTSLKRKDDLLEALAKELTMRKTELQDQKIETIYLGGGSPSILKPAELNQLFEIMYQNYEVATDAEITLEANPDDLSLEKIKSLADAPVNRLSIGIQSFFEDDLRFMNRAHTAEESIKCLEYSKQYFDNITIDLIYGLPGMKAEKWHQNLKSAFEFEVPHISSYALTVEEKTLLANQIKKGKVQPLEEQQSLEHFEILVAETEKQGFVQYEISNFGKEGYFSKHNTSYWLGANYLGIGPSAHSFDGSSRSWNVSNNSKYIKSLTQDQLPSEKEILTSQNRFNEAIMTGLRTIWGISLAKIESDFGLAYKRDLQKAAQNFIDTGLLEEKFSLENGKSLCCTQKGKFLADGIASELFIL